MRGLLQGGKGGKAEGGKAKGKSRSNAGPKIGLLILAGLGAAVGYVATRQRPDLDAPQILITPPAKTNATSTQVQGEVSEEDLASLNLEGSPVAFEEIGPGQYRFTAEVKDLGVGANVLELEATDRGGRSSKRSFQVTRVPFPVAIQFTTPAKNTVTRARTIAVSGQVRSKGTVESIKIADVALAVEIDGAFSGQIPIPSSEGSHVLPVFARGPDAEGKSTLRVIVDRTPPKIVIREHPTKVYGDTFDLPFRVEDHSDYVTVEVTGLGKVRRLHSGRDLHVSVPIAEFGEQVIEVRARDELGNAAQPVRISITRVKASSDLLAPFRRGQRAYRITKDITVRAGQTLVIPAGSRVQVETGIRISVEGKLIAAGTPSATIQISGRGWEGIRLKGELARAELRYTELRGAKSENGGALYLSRGAQATLKHCTLIHNAATKNGGAIYAVGRASTPCQLTLEDVTLIDNTAGAEGGALNLNSHCRARLTRVEFTKNHAQAYGGGVVLLSVARGSTEGEFTNCTFKKNSSGRGGGLQVGMNARARLKDCVLEENTATIEGGALFVQGRNPTQRGQLEVSGGRITQNRAPKGGGVAVRHDARVTLTRVDLIQNQATAAGGGLYANGGGGEHTAISLLRTHVVGNTSRLGGGIAVEKSVDLHADHVDFKANVAENQGGALWAQGPGGKHQLRLELVACTFRENLVQDPRRKRHKRGHGDDVRIGKGVAFDTAQLKSCGIPHSRASLAAGVHAPKLAKTPGTAAKTPARKPPRRRKRSATPATPPGVPAARRADPLDRAPPPGPSIATLPEAPSKGRALVEGDDDFGRALGHYVAAALDRDYHSLRADRFRSTSSRMKSYEAKIEFPGVVSTRIWDTGRRHYACVTLSNTAPDQEATQVFESFEARLKGHLGKAWTQKHRETRSGGRVTEFHHGHVRLRLTLTRYELRSGARATVMLFFN